MQVSEVKGLAPYEKVIDASIQDKFPDLSFTDEKGIRIVENAEVKTILAKDYSAEVQAKLENEKKEAILAQAKLENEKLQAEAERDALLAELLALKAEKAKLEAVQNDSKKK